jgi:hypothetical protein
MSDKVKKKVKDEEEAEEIIFTEEEDVECIVVNGLDETK